VINRNRSERGWRGRRRITVLVSVVGLLGIAALGTASTASAGFAACSGSVKVKGSNGTLSFQCSTEIRAFGITSNKTVKSFTDTPSVNGAPSAFVACTTQSVANGFGCGVQNRAINVDGTGIQAASSTGKSSNPDQACGWSAAVQPAGPQGNPPAVNGIVGRPCAQTIPAGSLVSQQISFGGNPCSTARKNPFLVFLVVGGEPIVSTFTVRGDSLGVGESSSEPFRLKIKGCPSAGGKKGKKSSAAAATAPAHASSGKALEPQSSLNCIGSISPKIAGKPSSDTQYAFACNQNIRLFTLITNRQSDFFGTETIVTGPGTWSKPCVNPPAPAPPLTPPQCASAESSAIQCEGAVPGFGAGCTFPDRQGNLSNVLTYGRRLSAGNTLTGDLGFTKSPCIRNNGEPALRVWVVAMTEPFMTATNVTGEFISQPFEMKLNGYGKTACAKALSSNKKKK
jgi:hypothetical protein